MCLETAAEIKLLLKSGGARIGRRERRGRGNGGDAELGGRGARRTRSLEEGGRRGRGARRTASGGDVELGGGRGCGARRRTASARMGSLAAGPRGGGGDVGATRWRWRRRRGHAGRRRGGSREGGGRKKGEELRSIPSVSEVGTSESLASSLHRRIPRGEFDPVSTRRFRAHTKWWN